MRLSLRPAVLQDLEEAYRWYEAQRPGLGGDYLAAVDEVLASVAEAPLRYRVLTLDTRQALVRRFPYRVLYRILGAEVVVVACFHASRDPRGWRQRR
ncbi:MAG: type II toxin-antitoxin system RelE/ParE family toxin [Planctomycetes bacterium]|nr:type II toxin-antitoxin system RelE/ParE family toxin [Planctomycetota bacterium]